jgi:hypothetical protein
MWGGGEHGEELYDYRTDPREMKNRATDGNMATVKSELRKRLDGILAGRGRRA